MRGGRAWANGVAVVAEAWCQPSCQPSSCAVAVAVEAAVAVVLQARCWYAPFSARGVGPLAAASSSDAESSATSWRRSIRSCPCGSSCC
eukprot:732672-Prymnesium_polylepis.1